MGEGGASVETKTNFVLIEIGIRDIDRDIFSN